MRLSMFSAVSASSEAGSFYAEDAQCNISFIVIDTDVIALVRLGILLGMESHQFEGI